MATVLVVDDHEVNRDLLRTVLGYHGHHVIEAQDATRGLALLRERFPDVVVTDVGLPDMDGYELVRAMRTGRATRHIPVIFYTADYLEQEARPLAAACGVHDVVPRSGDLGRLVAAVDSALSPASRPVTPAALSRVDARQLRLLQTKMLEKVREVEERQRLQELAAAAVAVTGDLSLPATVQRVVAAARSLVSADRAELETDAPGEDGEPGGEFGGELGGLGPVVGEGLPITGPVADEVVVPVSVRGAPFGRLRVVRRAGHVPFTDNDRTLLRHLADAAGTAVANASRFEEARRRQAWLSASSGIIAALLAAEPGEALELVVRGARRITGAQVAWVELAAEGGLTRVDAADGVGADALRGLSAAEGEAVLLQAVAGSGRPALLRDAARDGSGLVRQIAVLTGIGPLVAIPLRAADRFLGALFFGSAPDRAPFSRLDVEMCTTFAGNASLVLEFARAAADRERLTLVEDRERIARDLHDLVIQRLYATGLALDRFAAEVDPRCAARLHETVGELDRTIAEIRHTIYSLRSPVAGQGVRAAVVAVVERAAAALGEAPRLRLLGPIDTVVPEQVSGDLLATLREALSNVARHARASSVGVQVEVGDGVLRLEVVDDGVGMTGSSRRSGVANMRDRAELRGGRMTIGPGPQGRGTALVWEVPLP